LQNNAGSDCFFSPEACTGEKYSGKSADIWACAVTLYQMVFGKLPFNSANRINLYEQICKFEPNFIIEDIKLTECIM
jgi:serine/threonine protein kinase